MAQKPAGKNTIVCDPTILEEVPQAYKLSRTVSFPLEFADRF